MKKSYLILMIFASFSLTSISQNISSSNYPDTIIGKYTEGIIDEHLIITNTGSASMSMHVYRNTIDMPGNTVNYYCWGPNCFPPTTSLSTDPVFLGSGKSDSSFVAYLEPNQEEGITLVEFSFFDELGSGDSLKLNLVFKTVPPPISVWELEKQNNLNSIYPNPAKSSISVYMQDKKMDRIEMVDAQGRVMQEKQVFELKGVPTQLDLRGIANGVYFVKIYGGDESWVTRLVVANEN